MTTENASREPTLVHSTQDVKTPEPPLKAKADTAEPVEATKPAPKKATESTKSKATVPLDAANWPAILSALKQKYNTLYGVVRMAQPTFHEDNRLELAFGFAFHQKRISEAKNRQLLADTIKEVTGQDVHIDCVLDKNALPPKTPVISEILPEAPPEQLVSDITTISNIFGGGELLES